ncbi:hypothetical protein AA637_13455 [Cyanobacterium sp. HL-69]|uniref:DUF565 domain-containing protein n=1 Tax=unclassified Cyanobacterium TaxID=2629879 RepID=UPI0008525826|nr:DUF565 domain-containing protein [Cyanobacterium sp. IPPAS B-1200]AUC62085.1 hypothetical protein AA637_13455 [Cyanobacterium sp. HL-69]OEJ79514.1 hypothetical protein A5482_01280 [Cyanobacterium sp. IPPAS B-1200]
MQETRLNILLTGIGNQIIDFFSNPWRRLSLNVIAFLLGFFLANTISSIAGQAARWDVTFAFFFLLFTEGSNIIIYKNRNPNKPLWRTTLNAFKIGFAYSLYLEGLKLAS